MALQRLGNGLSAEVRALLHELFSEIVAELQRMDPTELASSVMQRRRIERLIAEVEELAGDAAAEALRSVRQRVAEIGAHQARFAAGLLRNTVGPIEARITPGVIGVARVKTILDRDPILGVHLRDSFEGVGAKVVGDVRREIQLGMTRGETIGDMVRRIRGRSDGRGGYVGGVLDTTTRGAESLVRTAVMDVSNVAQMETWRANEDVVEGYEVIVTLDSRTCPICGPKDGEVHDLDDPAGRPPFHRGCRCTTVPAIAWDRLGIDRPREGTRASADGPVPASTDYEGWLRSQDAATQEEILGPSRASLFRARKVGLADLIRSDGSIVTLDQLQ